jgi:hypothetical protein
MKTFRQFIIEARETESSQLAKQKGLRGNGHGDWYDSSGKLIGKTVNGELKIFSGREGKGPKETPQPKQAQSNSGTAGVETQGQDNQLGIAIAFGRFNPPAKGHEQLLKYGLARAKENGYDFRVYPSRVQDPGTNPLNVATKIKFLAAMFPEYKDYIVDSSDAKTVFDVLKALYNDGFDNVVIVVGAERLGEFQSLVHKADGQEYEFNNILVMPAPGKDPDSDTSGAGSSAALKTAVLSGNYDAFSANLPDRMKREDREALYKAVQSAMDVKQDSPTNESVDLWKIVPELDMEALRMNYKNNNLYPEDSLIENINTGLVGRVKRRGTNYLICVTEEGVMFKSWLQNVRAISEDVYEDGTDKYRKFLQSIIPGQPVKSFSKVKIKETVPKSINKLRK